MSYTAVVYIANGAHQSKGDIPYVYQGSPQPQDYATEWNNPAITTHWPLAQGVDYRCPLAVFDANGNLTNVITDPTKEAVIIMSAKTAQIQVAYQQMDSDIYAQMAVVFGTSRADSATAYIQTWALMQTNPTLFVPGYLVIVGAGSYVAGQFLTHSSDIQAYATAAIAIANNFAVYRMNRILQYIQTRAAILAG